MEFQIASYHIAIVATINLSMATSSEIEYPLNGTLADSRSLSAEDVFEADEIRKRYQVTTRGPSSG